MNSEQVFFAIFSDEYDLLKQHFDNGFDINHDFGNETILTLSVNVASDKIFDLILSYNPDINKKQKAGWTALSSLIGNVSKDFKTFDIVKRIELLLSRGASCLMSNATNYNDYVERDIFEQLEYEMSSYIQKDDGSYMTNILLPRKEYVYCLLRNRWCEEITLFQLMIKKSKQIEDDEYWERSQLIKQFEKAHRIWKVIYWDSGYDFIKQQLDDKIEDINATHPYVDAESLLIRAYSSSDRIFDLLLSYNPDVNYINKRGETVLYCMISDINIIDIGERVIERTTKLIEKGASCLIKVPKYSHETKKHTDRQTIFEFLDRFVKSICKLDYKEEYINSVKKRRDIVYSLLRNRWCEEVTLYYLMIENIDLDDFKSNKRQRID